jgi:hypothetical protein
MQAVPVCSAHLFNLCIHSLNYDEDMSNTGADSKLVLTITKQSRGIPTQALQERSSWADLPIGIRIRAAWDLVLALVEARRIPSPRPRRPRCSVKETTLAAGRRRRRRGCGRRPHRLLPESSHRHDQQQEKQQRSARSSSPLRSCHARTDEAQGRLALPC